MRVAFLTGRVVFTECVSARHAVESVVPQGTGGLHSVVSSQDGGWSSRSGVFTGTDWIVTRCSSSPDRTEWILTERCSSQDERCPRATGVCTGQSGVDPHGMVFLIEVVFLTGLILAGSVVPPGLNSSRTVVLTAVLLLAQASGRFGV